jgi:hypothetical protein
MAGERGKFEVQSDIKQRGKSFIRHQEIKYSNYCIYRDFVLYLGKRTNEAVKYPFTDDYRKRTDGK